MEKPQAIIIQWKSEHDVASPGHVHGILPQRIDRVDLLAPGETIGLERIVRLGETICGRLS